MIFRTHENKVVSGEQLLNALDAVANDWRQLALDIRSKDAYADHVTEEYKDRKLQEMLNEAEKIRYGKVESFTIWQRVNTKLTGECVALSND